MAYDNTNSGALFKNEEKDEDHPNWPDYRGQINVGGTEYWLSGWTKTSKKGDRFMSLSVQPKEPQKTQPAGQKARGGPVDDDIPFALIGKWL